MNPAFLDVLAEWAAENSEYFRSRGVTPTLTPRSEGRSKNSQALDLSHGNWEASLVVWDSGEAEFTAVLIETGASTILAKRWITPNQMREHLQEWLRSVLTV